MAATLEPKRPGRVVRANEVIILAGSRLLFVLHPVFVSNDQIVKHERVYTVLRIAVEICDCLMKLKKTFQIKIKSTYYYITALNYRVGEWTIKCDESSL